MAISNESKKILQAQLDAIKFEKQQVTKQIDDLKLKSDDLKVRLSEVSNQIDKIKADIDAL